MRHRTSSLLLAHTREGDACNLAGLVEPDQHAQRIATLEEEFYHIKGLVLYLAALSDLISCGLSILLEISCHFLHCILRQVGAKRGCHLSPVDSPILKLRK